VRTTDVDYADTAAEHSSEPRIGRSVSLDHAARLLGVSRRTIYNRIRDGRLQTIRTVGGSQRVLLDSVKGWRGQPSVRRDFV
jgi:excisionase family DNA binding protein